MRVGKHLGRSKRADQEKMMTGSAYLLHRIFRLQDSKVIPKASVENEKRGSMELPLEGSEGLQ